ncbi:hypothetical protein [Algirhabdus cladophorae]|uniref:hypothetical protein n=1 Tax=Algirhabdus cladophorae TaxID=3377108 RepID=UPI003B84700F
MQRPFHLTAMTILALLWFAFAGVDYILTQYNIAAYLEAYPVEQITYFTELPFVANGLWGLGTWSGVLGAILLWMREDKAVFALALAFFALIAAVLWLVFFTDPGLYAVAGPKAATVLWMMCAMNFIFFIYAREQRQNGLLT